MKKTILFAAAILMTATSGVLANDKVEKVDIAVDAIDLSPVVVGATKNGYAPPRAGSHVFKVRGFARANGNNRITGAWFYAGPTDHPTYDATLAYRDYGSGEKNQVKISYAFKVPTGKIAWTMVTPKSACEANLEKLLKTGMSAEAVLSKDHTLELSATVGFGVAAGKKGTKASNTDFFTVKKTTIKHKTLSYPVQVLCKAR